MIKRIVQKFGGTSLADLDLIRHAATLTVNEIKQNKEVIVVVSAMAGVTNELVSYTQSLNPRGNSPEHDVVHCAGEQVTAGLFALALNQMGYPAQSFLSWQLPIMTNDEFSNATIEHISTEKLEHCLASGIIPVIAGFQGLTRSGRLTTLGRGGSDTTAIAVACALNADICDIYTDVLGVYTADPRIVPNARKINHIHYDEMFELSKQGAKVLHKDCVEIAMKQGLNVRVLSTFVAGHGTNLNGQIEPNNSVCGIALSLQDVCLTLTKLPARTDLVAQVYTLLNDAGITLDTIIQDIIDYDFMDINITIGRDSLVETIEILNKAQAALGFKSIEQINSLAKISVIGNELSKQINPENLLENTLQQQGILTHTLVKTPKKVSILVDQSAAQAVVQILHQALKLDMEYDT